MFDLFKLRDSYENRKIVQSSHSQNKGVLRELERLSQEKREVAVATTEGN